MFLLINVSTLLLGQTYFSGTLFQDTTLYFDDSPYIITDNVVVPQEYTLTIEPGVELQFENEFSIKVYGEMQAVGNPQQRISFVSSNGQNNWLGVTVLTEHGFEYPEKSILFRYCDFTNANIVLSVKSRNSIEVSNCNIDNSFSGIRVSESDSSVIVNNTFNNGDYCIYLSSSNATYNLIENNVVSGYSEVGVFVFGDENSNFRNTRIIDNHISDCKNGVYITGGSNMREQWLVGNYLYNNGDGVRVNFSTGSHIVKNTFVSNNNALVVNRSVQNEINNNILINNGLGVLLKASKWNDVMANRILENSVGIELCKRDVQNVSEENNITANIFDANSEGAIVVNAGCQGNFDGNDILNRGGGVSFYNNSDRDQSAINCYWGTYNGSVIEQMVYHRSDNSELGFVDYVPFVFHSAVDCVEEPENVTKQLVGDTVVVRWMDSENPKVTSYRIYYESLGVFGFSDTLVAYDNEIKLVGYDISKNIFVTACDSEADGVYDQHEMHESWFKEADLIPFAGYDYKVCEGEPIVMYDATAPVYDSVKWMTTGQGEFSEEDIVETIYLPNEDDVGNDDILAILKLYEDGVEFSDTTVICILPAPEVYAGSDEFILYDSVLTILSATANYYDSTRWTTLGDGSFSDSSIVNPIYFPGFLDHENAEVKLVLQAFSNCGCVSDTMLLKVQSTYSVSGKIHGVEEQSRAFLYLINKDSSYKAQILISVEDEEVFEIDNVIKGDYYLYVIPWMGLRHYFPTYYVNKIHWKDAYLLNVSDDIYDIDIDLVKKKYFLPIGQGEINGTVLTEDDDVISRSPVFLCDTSGILLDWTTSDSYGEFFFKDLPYGFYKIMYEKAGFDIAYSSVIELSHENSIAGGVGIIQRKKEIVFNNDVVNREKLKIFPTLCSGILNISSDNLKENFYISMLDIGGNEVFRSRVFSCDNHKIRQINIRHLSNGIYFVKVFSGEEMIKVQKIVFADR
ncbi:MAG: right-handed parallel beta-helix repeat-containing protein [Bacteroidota bacterium]|nr:right-handed parallel beta-helix repeat-containing protein [Bacteroidota bacterium]